MPAKKAATKKKTSKRKTSVRKTVRSAVSRKKRPAASKRRTSPSRKRISKKGTATSKRKTARKALPKKRTAASKKKTAAAARRSTKKATASKKKTTSKKRASTRKTVSPAGSGSASAPRTSVRKTTSSQLIRRPPPARRRPELVKLSAKTNLLNGPLRGFKPYKPSRGEVYMSSGQLEHFREILLAWKRELMEEVDRTVLHMKDDAANFPDPNDRATQESEFGLELRTRDRERKLLKKIDSALARIEDGSYGFCEETGDEIGLRRLEARPVATLCVEAQERRELAERQFRDREDHYR